MLTSASAYYDNRASYDRLKQYRGDEERGRGEGVGKLSFRSVLLAITSRVTLPSLRTYYDEPDNGL